MTCERVAVVLGVGPCREVYMAPRNLGVYNSIRVFLAIIGYMEH